jgi:hypothetical protein
MVFIFHIITKEYLYVRYNPAIIPIPYNLICLICSYKQQDLKFLNSTYYKLTYILIFLHFN